MSSLNLVGPTKAIGYLPLRTIEVVLCLKVDEVVADACARGLVALRIEPPHCCISSGALYLYDPGLLTKLLASSAVTLESSGFPAEPEAFVRAIAREWLDSDHPLMPIVRAAFADEPASGRTTELP